MSTDPSRRSRRRRSPSSSGSFRRPWNGADRSHNSRSTPTWPKELPEGWITGQLGGVCRSAQDHVYVVNRRNITDEEKETSISAPSIIKFDVAGNVVGSWGDQNTVPGSIHGCLVDRDGNVWVAGNGDGIIQKYAPDGKLLMQIGTARQVRLGRRHPPRRRPATPPATSSTCRPAS